MNTTKTRNWNLIWSRLISWMFILGTAFFSASHIYSVGRTGGLSILEAAAAVPFIDGFGVLGRVLRSLKARKARRGGTVLMVIAGLVSLSVNVIQGHTVIQRAFGVVTVVGFVAAEWAAGLVKEAAVETTAPAAPQITAADVQSAVNAAVTAAMAQATANHQAALAQAATDAQDALDAAVKAAVAKAQRSWTAKARRERQQAEAAAPISPAGPVATGLIIPTTADLRAAVYAA